VEGLLQRNQDDHEIILAAIKSKDADGAFHAMRKHTLEQGDSVIENVPAFSRLTDRRAGGGNSSQFDARVELS
jgi:DNA-binding GntR family transcriptional regulator